MKRFVNSLALLVLLFATTTQVWSQAPSTEGRDFWVTFLRAADDDPTELKLTISAREACNVLIENPTSGLRRTQAVGDNSRKSFVVITRVLGLVFVAAGLGLLIYGN